MKTWARFGWGLLGGVAPYALKASKVVGIGDDIPHLGWAYCLTHLAIMVLSAGWSVALESDKPWKAVYHGATFPLVFSTLFAHVPLTD